MDRWCSDANGDYFFVDPDGKIIGNVIRVGYSDRFTAHTGVSGCLGEYINRDAAKAAVEKASARLEKQR